ncbi:hypothetical protein DR098_03840 [Mycoplasma hyorhinis]|nr:hypothetical protein [Mesomycoplasma hyorhinis]
MCIVVICKNIWRFLQQNCPNLFFFFFGNMKKIYKFNVFYNNLKKNFTNLSGNKTISNFQELFLFSNK